MIKALLLIFEPVGTWDGIFRARRSLGFILALYLLPLLLVTSAAEGFGLVHWGKKQGEFGRLNHFPLREAVLIEAAQILVSLVVVFGGASLIKAVGETFHGRHTYTQAFTAVAYSMGPFFLLRLLDTFPGLSPWVAWAIGMSLTVAALYQGVPRMMAPDPPHAFGLYVMSALLLVSISGLVRFATATYLQGKFPALQSLITGLAARLPF
ncbi:MAG: YIP1 family protein [Verrucomicrobiota bacterium]